jgi:hypothetical protein
MNPYAGFLGDNDALEQISLTPGRLRALLETIGPQRARLAPAPGKWSFREILCHLADCEIVFAFRIRQALAQPHHVIQPFDQDLWAANYAAYDAASALAVFTAVRNWSHNLLQSLPPEAFSKTLTHPERGAMSLQVLLETMAGHDLNHLNQFESLAARVPAA